MVEWALVSPERVRHRQGVYQVWYNVRQRVTEQLSTDGRPNISLSVLVNRFLLLYVWYSTVRWWRLSVVWCSRLTCWQYPQALLVALRDCCGTRLYPTPASHPPTSTCLQNPQQSPSSGWNGCQMNDESAQSLLTLRHYFQDEGSFMTLCLRTVHH